MFVVLITIAEVCCIVFDISVPRMGQSLMLLEEIRNVLITVSASTYAQPCIINML